MRLRFVLVVLLLVAPSLRALAGPADDLDTDIARRHFARGLRSYERGEYDQALVEFEAAARVHPRPALDYNIGRCLDRLERIPEAIAAYRRYVESVPAPSDAPAIRARIGVLSARLPPPEPAPREPVLPSPPMSPAAPRPPNAEVTPPAATSQPPALTLTRPPQPPSRLRLLPAILVGAAAIVVLAGGTLSYLTAASDYDQLASGPSSCRPCRPDQYADVQLRAELGYGLWAAAGAIAAVDVVLWVLALRHRASDARVSLQPSLAGVRGTF